MLDKGVRMLSIMEGRQVVGEELGSQLENQSDPSVLQRRSCRDGHSWLCSPSFSDPKLGFFLGETLPEAEVKWVIHTGREGLPNGREAKMENVHVLLCQALS